MMRHISKLECFKGHVSTTFCKSAFLNSTNFLSWSVLQFLKAARVESLEALVVGMILLMIYTGFRIAAFRNITYNEAEQYFQGGVKTAAGKNRIVPLHPAVQGFAKTFADDYCSGNKVFSVQAFRSSFHQTLASLTFIIVRYVYGYELRVILFYNIILKSIGIHSLEKRIHHTTADIPSHGSVINITLMICQNTY